MQQKHSFEQHLVFKNLEEMLAVIDPKKENQLNDFIRKLKASQAQFQAKDFLTVNEEVL